MNTNTKGRRIKRNVREITFETVHQNSILRKKSKVRIAREERRRSFEEFGNGRGVDGRRRYVIQSAVYDEEAAKVYDHFAVQLHGLNVVTNFPAVSSPTEQPCSVAYMRSPITVLVSPLSNSPGGGKYCFVAAPEKFFPPVFDSVFTGEDCFSVGLDTTIGFSNRHVDDRLYDFGVDLFKLDHFQDFDACFGSDLF